MSLSKWDGFIWRAPRWRRTVPKYFLYYSFVFSSPLLSILFYLFEKQTIVNISVLIRLDFIQCCTYQPVFIGLYGHLVFFFLQVQLFFCLCFHFLTLPLELFVKNIFLFVTPYSGEEKQVKQIGLTLTSLQKVFVLEGVKTGTGLSS